MSDTTSELIAVKEVCQIVGNVSVKTIERWMARQDNPFPAPITQPKGKRLWNRSAIKHWLKPGGTTHG